MSELRLKSTGTIKLFENDNTSNVTIASPASLTTDRTITLPDGDVTLVAGTMSTGGVALTGSTNNQVTTVTGADAITGETNLTYNGTILGCGATGASADLGVGIHVRTADASQGSVNANADELILENSAGCGITILSGASNLGRIAFGDSGDGAIAFMDYNHSSNELSLTGNGNTALKIDSTGAVIKPLQPAFLTVGASGTAPAIATQSNPFATVMTEIYDKNSDLSSAAVFTAPVTGTYVFYMHTKYTSSDGNIFDHYFKASNRNSYFMDVKALDTVNGGSNTQWVSGSCSVDMDASDTMTVTTDWNETANRDRNTDPNWTYFSGYLLC